MRAGAHRVHPGTAPSGLPLPRSERGRGSGRGGARVYGEQLSGPKVPPLPGPLLPRREEREFIVRDPGAVAGCAPLAGRGVAVDLDALEPWEDPQVWEMI